MKQEWYQYKGFTLLEMIIVLIISTVLIIICFNLLGVVSKEWAVFSKMQNRVTSTLFFKKIMDHDLEHADYILKTDRLDLSFISVTDTVVYHFSSAITRTVNNSTDTFDIKLSAYTPVPLESVKDMELIKEINLTILEPIEMKDVSFYKYYTSADLMTLFY